MHSEIIQIGCFCIAEHICGPVRASPGGSVEHIVVAGGYDGSSVLNTVEVYNISSNMWTMGVCNNNLGVSLGNPEDAPITQKCMEFTFFHYFRY